MHFSLPLILFIILIANCAPKRPDPTNDKYDDSAPVVVVNGEEVTLKEFQRRIQALPPFAASRLSTLEAQRAHVAGVAQFEVLAQEGIEKGFEKDADTAQKLDDAIIKQWIKNQTIDISEIDIAAEIERKTRTIHFGLAYIGTDCESEWENLRALPLEKRISTWVVKAKKNKPDDYQLLSFSDRLPSASTLHPELVNIKTQMKSMKRQGEISKIQKSATTCAFAVLTKIETTKPTRANIEEELRRQKRVALEKKFRAKK